VLVGLSQSGFSRFTAARSRLGRGLREQDGSRFTAPRSRLGSELREQAGFSFIELLVVALMVGILAAIALPSFLGQKGKAVDAQAKALARTAETAAETVGTDYSGSYTKVGTAELNRVEPAIRISPSTSEAYLISATGGEAEYAVTVKATNGDELSIARSSAGTVTRECVSPRTKTGCSGGARGSW
jgi:type IV pilus assembly protein PilA